MSITLHELADRMRDQLPAAGDSLEIRFSTAGLVESATLVQRLCPRNIPFHDCKTTRTKIV